MSTSVPAIEGGEPKRPVSKASTIGAVGGGARRQLLTDHAQRQELIALQAQDRAQARDVA